MKAYISLKNGKECSVNNITCIKEFSLSKTLLKEYTEFKDFSFVTNHYAFIGNEILTVSGSDILCIFFDPK